MPSDLTKTRPAYLHDSKALYLIGAAIAVLLLLAISGPAFAQVDPNECVNGSTDCVVENNTPRTILLWSGVLFLSWIALIAFKARSIRESKDPTVLIGLTSMAVLNTVFWMIIYYSVSFLVKTL